MTYKIDINIVDDHQMLLDGLTQAIDNSDIAHVSHIFKTLESCRQMLEERRPDVLLLDISMPDGNGIEFCQYVRTNYPQVKVVAITYHDEYSIIRRMLDIGVHGYVLKSSPIDELLCAIRTVYQGEQYLTAEVNDIISKADKEQVFMTPMEQNVLRLICEGLTNPQIAERLCMSQDTASWYRKRLLAKFHVCNTAGLVALAIREHLLDIL